MKFPDRLSQRAACHVAAILGIVPGLAQACSYEPYLGEVCLIAASYCPVYDEMVNGTYTRTLEYLPADGRTLPIAKYNGLFTIFATTYGGDGVTTFGLPDLRGRAPVGTGQGKDLAAVAPAQAIGQQHITLTRSQIPPPQHTHDAVFTATTGPVPAAIQPNAGTLAIDATLTAGGVSAKAVPVPPAGTAYLSAISANAGLSPMPLKGPYASGSPAGKAALAADVTIEGSPARAATTVKIGTINGGTVAVTPTQDVAASDIAPVPTQSAGLGVTVCIAATGQFPYLQK